MNSTSVKKKYKTAIVFNKEMIAPCGMNCGSCMAYMRYKDHCPGCRVNDDHKPASCKHCIIINCDHLKETDSKFCYDCPKYPCPRLKRLEKRYKTKYNTSFFDNLAMIKEKGIDSFLAFETDIRACPHCGATLCLHRTECFECGASSRRDNISLKPFNDCVSEYRKLVEKGDIVAAYRGLMEFMMSLRTHFKNNYPDYSISGSIYYGYMDMTYFPLVPEKLKEKGLKIAIVLIHDRLRFEAWLSGYNKGVQLKYWDIIKEKRWDKYRIPATIKGQDSIVECDLVSNPDFSDLDMLTEQIESRTKIFIQDVEEFLESI